ncbi:hypothetical protein L7F22_043250 [Adiantum nelumboides]|nr:hypothetical protein [Adiantum nelumboides]
MVRFRFGYSRSSRPLWSGLLDCFSQRGAMDDYVWTYVSPTFPMRQAIVLQTFELPKPTLCIGGICQIQLIGRVQTQQIDGLYYIGVNYVNVTGHPIPFLKLDRVDEEGQYYFRRLSRAERNSSARESCQSVSMRNYSVAMLSDYLVQSGLHKNNVSV